MKKCPFCAEDIRDAAIVCKHCRRDLPSVPETSVEAIPDIVLDQGIGQLVEEQRSTVTPPLAARPPKTLGVAALVGLVLLVGFVLVVLLVLVAVLTPSRPTTWATSQRAQATAVGTQQTPPVVAAPQQSQDSLEYKLAVLNHGGYVARDEITVARFRFLLTQLSLKYGETSERIGDMSVMARNQLAEKGVSESILNIMEGMNQIVDGPGAYGKDPYANFLTLYNVERISGKSHDFAIDNLRGVIRELGLK